MIHANPRLDPGFEFLRFHERSRIIPRVVQFFESLEGRFEIALLRGDWLYGAGQE
jgi:hypothetical protein